MYVYGLKFVDAVLHSGGHELENFLTSFLQADFL